MQGKVEICGVNTARLPVLKNDEMMELLRRTKQGDMAARERLIRGNLRLVLSVIQRFSSRGENADDLFQVGCIGLIKAIDNFDIRQPVRFSTYGVPMIVGEIRRYLRDNSTLRVSRSMRDTAYKVLQARERLLRQQQREPTVEQIAQELATTDNWQSLWKKLQLSFLKEHLWKDARRLDIPFVYEDGDGACTHQGRLTVLFHDATADGRLHHFVLGMEEYHENAGGRVDENSS